MSHKRYRQENNCLNCGTIVEQKFCGECGQENLELREDFLHLVGHFISDYLHYDSKFFQSIKLLLLKPGLLTKAYWEGQRVKYIHPLRLYFFVLIIAVLCSNIFYNQFGDQIKRSTIRETTAKRPEGIEKDPAALKKFEEAAATQKARQQEQIGKLNKSMDFFIRNTKWVSFFFLPVFAGVFYLLYIRRKALYSNHLIYVLHQQSFLNVYGSILLIIPVLYPPAFNLAQSGIFLLILLYAIFSLKYLYGQSWGKTITKSILSTILIFFTYMIGMVLVMLYFLAFT